MSASSQVMREAERWLGRLDSEHCLPEDREAFGRWHSAPGHAEAYARVRQLWDAADALQADPEIERLKAEILENTAPGGRRSLRRRVAYAMAASVAVCVLAPAAFLLGRHYVPSQTYVTEAGQRSTVELEDGSQVILNSGTRLTVRFAADKRQFTLRQGEALFSVAEDPARPFTVQAGDGRVTALGTRFLVRNDARRVIVTLIAGRVAVDREDTGQHVQLRPGEQVRFTGDAPGMQRRAVDTEVAGSWTTGRLKFRATPLAEVLEEVNRYSKTKIWLGDASLASTPVNATFRMGNSASVVSALESLLPLEATVRGSHQIVLTPRR